MKLSEKKKDLFTVGNEYYLAHCIASDLGMGAGIAVQIQKKFGVRGKIQKSGEDTKYPTCILTGRVFNLITKGRSPRKPSYATLQGALEKMKSLVEIHQVKKLAMPKIGCGLDRLQWPRVREILVEVFDGVEIEILICKWK